jgi:hypothetical protein
VDQDQFAAMSVPKMDLEAEPKPYNQNQKRIVDNLPETRLEGNHYITTDPEWVRTKGAEGAKIGRGWCSVCCRFWKFDRGVTTICPVCKVHLCADGCFLQWHREHPDFGATYCGWGLHKGIVNSDGFGGPTISIHKVL